MNCVTSIKIGKKYSSIYVNNLYKAIRKQCDLDFICFTDDSTGIDPNVIVYDMQPLVKDSSRWKKEDPWYAQYVPHLADDPNMWMNSKMKSIGSYSWWPAWNKLALFAREELDKYEKKIFFDLDMVIQGDIKPILDFETNFALTPARWKSEEWANKKTKRNVQRNKLPKFTFTSTCFVWKNVKFIYEQYIPNWQKYARIYNGIDVYLHQNHLSEFELLPKIFYSYREGSEPEHYRESSKDAAEIKKPYFKYMPEYSVCNFHQKPDIHELDHEHILYKIWNDSL